MVVIFGGLAMLRFLVASRQRSVNRTRLLHQRVHHLKCASFPTFLLIRALRRLMSASTLQVGVFATRSYKVGDEIPLRGFLVPLSDREDDELRAHARDFSVLYSSKKKCFNMLIGPARFVNVHLPPLSFARPRS